MSIAILRHNLPLAIINSLHMAVFSALSLILPLYLLEQNFDLSSIGLILSIMPLILLIMRTLFSLLADVLGTRMIFLAESLGMIAALGTYAVASTPVFFSLGKIFEGIGHSAYWAVIRTETYRAAPKGEERFASYMQSLRSLGEFMGRVLAGAILFYLGFTQTLWFFAVLSILLVIGAWHIRRSVLPEKLDWTRLRSILLQRRSRGFWHVALIMALAVSFYSSVDFFLYPIYMKSLGFDAFYIGSLLAAYAVLSGLMMMVATKRGWGVRRVAGLILVLGVLPFLVIDRMDSSNAIFLIGTLALGEGLVNILFERSIARVTKGSTHISTDIAVLHVPYRGAEFIVLAGIGFVVGAFGFHAAFMLVAAALALFALLAARFLVATDPAYLAVGYKPWGAGRR